MNIIPVAVPDLGELEARAAAETILSGWVTQGPRVAGFEKIFSEYVGSHYACAVANCTVALHFALLAVGVRPGDTVITVSHSFIATANAIRHCGAEPVFTDIDPNTLNMDLDELERIIAEDFEPRNNGFYFKNIDWLAQGESPLVGRSGRMGRLAAVLAVHQAGMPIDMVRLLALTKPLKIPVVEDAACAAGSEICIDGMWQKIGKPHGDIACFSFHPRKVITTGDGGMLTTSNPKYDQLFRLLRQHGMSVSDAARHGATEVIFENYQMTGFNARLTDIQASVGIEQVKRLSGIIKRRRKIAPAYFAGLVDVRNLTFINEPLFARTNWQSFLMFVDNPAKQKPIMQALLKEGISTRRGIMCAHLEVPYIDSWRQETALVRSERARDTGIILPLYSSMSDDDVNRVINTVRQVCRIE